ncbi:MAG: hypothetical protein H0T04_06205 [Chloroflexi bacterium]|nr:hypothetical protein [Chloroflexota bacterium]
MDRDRGAAQGTVETEPGWRSRQARAVGAEPGWADWRRSAGGGRSFPLLGIFLVLIGVALLIQQFQPGISLTSLLVLALGLALGAVWLLGGVRGAFVPAAFLLALALARLVVELRLVSGEGWTALFLGLGLLAIWGVGRWQRARRPWALWLGVIVVLIGLAQISLQAAGFRELGLIWPALIILIGGTLLVRSRMSGVRTPA